MINQLGNKNVRVSFWLLLSRDMKTKATINHQKIIENPEKQKQWEM